MSSTDPRSDKQPHPHSIIAAVSDCVTRGNSVGKMSIGADGGDEDEDTGEAGGPSQVESSGDYGDDDGDD